MSLIVPSVPTDPANTSPAIWYDLPRQLAEVANGTAIAQVDDFSGNDRHGTQGTTAAQGEVAVNQVNGLPVILTDGDDDRYFIQNTSALTQNIGSMVVYAVAQSLDTSGNRYQLFFSTGSGGFTRCGLRQNGSVWSTGARRLDTDAFASTSSGVDTDTFAIVAGHYDWAGNQLHIYVNGDLADTSAISTAGNTSDTASGSNVFAGAPTAAFWHGHTAEQIVRIGTPTPQEFSGVHLYLEDKYGINTNVPRLSSGAFGGIIGGDVF